MGRQPRIYTLEFRQAAIERVKNGEQRVAVAQDLDISPSLIDNWRHKLESGEGFMDRKSYTPEFKEAAVARLKEESVTAVAKSLGIAPSMVSDWRSTRGQPPGKRQEYTRRSYDDAFKRAAVARVKKGELQMTVAKDLGIHHTLIANWMKPGGQGAPKKKTMKKKTPAGKPKTLAPKKTKKNYYIKVADRVPGLFNAVTENGESSDQMSRRRALAIQSCVAMLRKLQPQINVSDPVHLTAALVLATLEGKM